MHPYAFLSISYYHFRSATLHRLRGGHPMTFVSLIGEHRRHHAGVGWFYIAGLQWIQYVLDTKGRDMNILQLLDLPSPPKYSLLMFPSSWSTSSVMSCSPQMGYPIPTLQKAHQTQPHPKCSHGALSFLPQVLVKSCCRIPQLPVVIYKEGSKIH